MSVLRLEPAEGKPCSHLRREGLVGVATVPDVVRAPCPQARPGAEPWQDHQARCPQRTQKAHTLTSNRGSHRGLHATPPHYCCFDKIGNRLVPLCAWESGFPFCYEISFFLSAKSRDEPSKHVLTLCFWPVTVTVRGDLRAPLGLSAPESHSSTTKGVHSSRRKVCMRRTDGTSARSVLHGLK